MTMEIKEVGLAVGEDRVGRLMRLNGIKPVRNRKHIHAQRAGFDCFCDTALTVLALRAVAGLGIAARD